MTDRFAEGIEQLGSDKLDVRIGGIYVLERVARDSAKDHPAVMEVLTAFIRERSREPWPPSDAGQPVQERPARPDVQAAATVVGRRDAKRDILPVNLAGANLTRVDLARADLTRVDLARADLTGANLARARLVGARLTRADLTSARLTGAHLFDAVLAGADLTGAVLTRAILIGAHLTGANLTRANLTRANLTRAHLTGAHLTRAGDPRIIHVDLTDADLTGVRWPEGVQVPEGWVVDSDSGGLKPAAQLSEVTARYP